VEKGKGILAQVERGGVIKKQKSIKSAVHSNIISRTINKLVK
jgi:hypothetical protein